MIVLVLQIGIVLAASGVKQGADGRLVAVPKDGTAKQGSDGRLVASHVKLVGDLTLRYCLNPDE